MIRTVARLAAVAGVSVIMLAVAPATAPANTPSASIQFVSQAQLQPNGTALVSVDYLCNPDFFGSGGGFVAVELQQPGAFGIAESESNCNDQKHKVTLDVGFGPFSPGTASAEAFVSNSDVSSHADKQAELTVK